MMNRGGPPDSWILSTPEEAYPNVRVPECFGDANMSDTCAQCRLNDECVDETMKRFRSSEGKASADN